MRQIASVARTMMLFAGFVLLAVGGVSAQVTGAFNAAAHDAGAFGRAATHTPHVEAPHAPPHVEAPHTTHVETPHVSTPHVVNNEAHWNRAYEAPHSEAPHTSPVHVANNEAHWKPAAELQNRGLTTPVGKTFDQARSEAFGKARMTDGNVKFTKVDPKTGTVVEFKGSNGAKVAYDGPHATPGPGHDSAHVGWQTGGKRGVGGRERGNITYTGPQHPSRSSIKGDGNVDPH